MAWNGPIQAAIAKVKEPFKIVRDHQILDGDGWAIPKGSKNIKGASKLIAYASQPPAMANQTNDIGYSPAKKDSAPGWNCSLAGADKRARVS